MISGRPARLILVRHGATEWSQNGRHTGRTDLPLTDVGRDQCRQLRPVLEDIIRSHDDQAPTVFTSTLSRASETAALVLPWIEAAPTELLLEVDYGQFEGLTNTEIAAIDPTWNVFTHGCPGGESVAAISARCDSFIAKTERMAAGRTVVAFTHGHLGRALAVRALGYAAAFGSALYNDTASIAVIDERRGIPVLTVWNRGAH
jgi:probable phosphoglycerate mutase